MALPFPAFPRRSVPPARRRSCRLRVALLALLVLAAPAAAHPIAKHHHDRTVLVRLTESGVIVEYTLALDAWTLAQDLLPFSSQIDYAGDPQQLYKAFAAIYGPRMANDLIAGIDGQELRFTYAGEYQLKEEDHLRYTFLFRAPLRLDPARAVHRLILTDSNFAFEPGVFKLAVRSEGRVAIKESNVADDPEKAKPVELTDFNPARDEKLRTARVTFTVPAASPPADEPPAAPADVTGPPAPRPTPAEVAGSFSLRRLLESDHSGWGLALVLALAFLFGMVHALQPGHGKTLVAAYLVGERGTVGHALFLGLVTTLTHTSSVFILAIVVPLLFPGEKMDEQVHFGLALGCGVLVILLAFWLLLRRLGGQADHVHLFGGHHHHHGHGHHHHDHQHHSSDRPVTWWALVTMGITGGLVPCVDALALLGLSWMTNQLWLGLPLILAFSVGLASVLVAVGVAVVKFKHLAQSRWGEGRFVQSLPIVGALATLGLGVWMCLDALSQRPAAFANPPAASVQTDWQP